MRGIRAGVTTALSATLLVLAAGPALACGGLIGPNGAVNLLRTSTFAGYHDGIEHYVTAFSFAGGGGKFGSITPLPGVPTKVERGGDWTLQRLIRETTPVAAFSAEAGATSADTALRSAKVLLEAKVDALDITILEGGGTAVGTWAKEHGFQLPPDAPQVLDFYADRSPIFMAAAFDADRARARGQQVGDGTPVHLTIPTANPWVPLRILGLGKQGAEQVQADVFLLTDVRPTLLAPTGTADPAQRSGLGVGLTLAHDQRATTLLLDDLRSDKGMSWIPRSGWLTKVTIDAPATALQYDLAIDASGQQAPSQRAAGLPVREIVDAAARGGRTFGWLVIIGLFVLGAGVALGRLADRPTGQPA